MQRKTKQCWRPFHQPIKLPSKLMHPRSITLRVICKQSIICQRLCASFRGKGGRVARAIEAFPCDRSLMKCVLRTRLHTSLRTRPHHVLRFIALTIKPQGECQLRLSSPSIERHAVTRKLRYLGTRHDAVLLATAELLRCPESKPLALFWQVYEVKHINWKSLLNLIGKALATIICFYHNQKENLWVSLIPWRVRLASNAGVPLFRPGEKTPCLFIYYCTLKRAAMDFAFLCELMASR